MLALLLTESVSSTSILMSYYLSKSATEGNLSTTLIGLPQLIGFYTGGNVV